MEQLTRFSDLNPNGIYTYADYLKWGPETRIELIGGRPYDLSPAPRRRHQRISSDLQYQLYAFLRSTGTCEVYSAPFDVRLPSVPTQRKQLPDQILTVVQPDLCVICDASKLDDAGCLGAPDLIVEILSPKTSKKDTIEKYFLYEQAGVTEYWMVYPREEFINVFVLNERLKYDLAQIAEKSEQLRSPTLVGFSLDLDGLFR